MLLRRHSAFAIAGVKPWRVALQRSQRLAHSPELFRVGIAADPRSQLRGEAGITLPQCKSGLPCQINQLRTRPVIKAGVRRFRDVLLHDRCVNGDLV